MTALNFNGMIIRDRDEMLSLTDMWRAAGSPENKRPAEWLRQEATVAFVEYVMGTLDVGVAHIQTERGGRGVGGSTFAHWQIGLAYAKYLSPEFHMWCNTVVRARMEGTRPPCQAAAPQAPFARPADTAGSGLEARNYRRPNRAIVRGFLWSGVAGHLRVRRFL